MAEAEPSPPLPEQQAGPTITDMDMDPLVHCASYLNLDDVVALASSCKYLNRVAYSDPIWHRFFRERWPHLEPSSISPVVSGAREAYLARYTALQKFQFLDPVCLDFHTEFKHFHHMYLNQNEIVFSQGPMITIVNIDSFPKKINTLFRLRDHRARITCMRFFPLHETSLLRGEDRMKDNVLVTSSCDHSIRLWWKGWCQRCFKGHNGPVLVLSDKLLGDGAAKIFASGGEDSTVRLWSLSSTGKRGQHALKATLYGHEKSVVLTSVAGHNTSLLVSLAKDSKVRVWDTTASSSVRDSCCVGRILVPGAPVSMKCHDSLIYVAAGSSVSAIDLRTMSKVFSIANTRGKLHSFEVMPSKYLVCTGGTGRAMLWDIRKSSNAEEAGLVTEMDGHTGPVTHLYMDQYKIVSGGPEDSCVNVWEADTGTHTISLICSEVDDFGAISGCSAMAVDGCQVVTGSCVDQLGLVRFRDFEKATDHISTLDCNKIASKFWC